MGIEPTYAAWKAAVLPLNYTRNGRNPSAVAALVNPRHTTEISGWVEA